MKSALLLLMAALLLGFSIWFFHQSAELLASRDYLAGAVHIFVGFATIKTGVQLARLSVVVHSRS